MSLLDKAIVAALPITPKFIVGRVSRRYVAGTRLEDAVAQVKRLNSAGFMSTLDLLGENITRTEMASEVEAGILGMIDAIVRGSLDSNISIKLTQLGLQLDKEFCYRSIRNIVQTARTHNMFIRIDMEDSSTTDDTLEIYRRLRDEGLDNTGVVIQAYMKRSADDIRMLAKYKTNIRLCKGIYIEPPAIAYRDREEVRQNYLRLLDLIFELGMYPGIATHDDVLVSGAMKMIGERRLDPKAYEFQMLLGVRETLRDQILAKGHRLRVYVPYGEQWYAYCTRRLRENPQIGGYVFKAMFGLHG